MLSQVSGLTKSECSINSWVRTTVCGYEKKIPTTSQRNSVSTRGFPRRRAHRRMEWSEKASRKSCFDLSGEDNKIQLYKWGTSVTECLVCDVHHSKCFHELFYSWRRNISFISRRRNQGIQQLGNLLKITQKLTKPGFESRQCSSKD